MNPIVLTDGANTQPQKTLDERILQLEDLLDTGAESVTVDGVSTRINLEQVRQRLRDLYRQKHRRGHVDRIDLSQGFFEGCQDYRQLAED